MEGFVEVETPRPRRAALRDRVELRLARSAVLAVLLVGGVLVASAFVLGYATGRFLEPESADDPFYAAHYAPPPAVSESSARAPARPPRPAARATPLSAPSPRPTGGSPTVAAAPSGPAPSELASPAASAPSAAAPSAAAPSAAAPSEGDPPEEAAPSPPRVALIETAPERGYGVQLGAFESRAEAEAFVETHAAALSELPVHLLPAEVPKRGTWWRVRVGLAPSRARADRLRRAMPASLAGAALVVSYR